MKSKIWLGIVITFVVLFSSCTKDENITTPPPAPPIPTPEIWRTVFFDDFNRANTVNGDLGSNWEVFDTTHGATMQITDNEVRSVAKSWCPYAIYFQDLNYTRMRISIKMRTDSIVTPNIILFVIPTMDTNLYDGYCVGYDNGRFFMGAAGNISYSGSLSANTTYILEIITNSTGFEATMYDPATGHSFIDDGITADFVSGFVGFLAGAGLPNAIYVDDFKIEILE